MTAAVATPAPTLRARTALLLVGLLLAGCVASPSVPDAAKIDRLLSLIGQRIAYMDGVARTKWNSGAPIEDLPREQEIIDGIGDQAARYGLDAALAREFFRAQIEASKTIQRGRFRQWRADRRGPFASVPDLRRDVRPALDALTPEMLTALAAAQPVLAGPLGAAALEARVAVLLAGDAADAQARDQALEPLRRMAQGR